MKHHEQPTLSVVMIMVFIAIIVLILAALAICSHTSTKLGGIANRTSARPYRPLYRSSSTRSTRYGGALVAKDPNIVTNLTAALTNTLLPSNRYNTLISDTVKTIEDVSKSLNRQTGESSGNGTVRNVTDFQKMPDLLKSIIANKQISADVFKTLKFEALFNKQGNMRLPYYNIAADAYWNMWGLTSNTDSSIKIPTGIDEFIQDPTNYETITPNIADAFKHYLSNKYYPMDLSQQTNLVSLLNKYTMKTRQEDYKYVARTMLSEINSVIKPYEDALGMMKLTDPVVSDLTTRLHTIKDNINGISTNLDTTPLANDINPNLLILINSTAADIDRLIDEIIALELKVSSAPPPSPPTPPPPGPPPPGPPPLAGDAKRISDIIMAAGTLTSADTTIARKLGLFNVLDSTGHYTHDPTVALFPETDLFDVQRLDNLLTEGPQRVKDVNIYYSTADTQFLNNPVHKLTAAMNHNFELSTDELFVMLDEIAMRRSQILLMKADVDNELNLKLDTTINANYIKELQDHSNDLDKLFAALTRLSDDIKDSLLVMDFQRPKSVTVSENYFDRRPTSAAHMSKLGPLSAAFTSLYSELATKIAAKHNPDDIPTSANFFPGLKAKLATHKASSTSAPAPPPPPPITTTDKLYVHIFKIPLSTLLTSQDERDKWNDATDKDKIEELLKFHDDFLDWVKNTYGGPALALVPDYATLVKWGPDPTNLVNPTDRDVRDMINWACSKKTLKPPP